MQRKENKRRQPSWSVASCWGTERGQSATPPPSAEENSSFLLLHSLLLTQTHAILSYAHIVVVCCLVSGNGAGGDGTQWKPAANQPLVEAHLYPPFAIWRKREHVRKWGRLVRFTICHVAFVQLWKCNLERRPFSFPEESANSPLFVPTANICHRRWNLGCFVTCCVFVLVLIHDKWCLMTGSWEHAYGLLITLSSCSKTHNNRSLHTTSRTVQQTFTSWSVLLTLLFSVCVCL